jgi:hypothetical protein
MSAKVKLFTLMISLILASCGSNSNQTENQDTHQNPDTKKPAQPTLELARPRPQRTWKLTYSSKCKKAPNEECIGAYGFTAKSDGTFQIGPGPDGQILTGDLSDEEVAEIRDQLTHIPLPDTQHRTSRNPSLNRDTDTSSTEKCVHGELSSIDRTIEINYQSAPIIRIQTDFDQFCFRSVPEDSAHEIEKIATNIINKYHPSKFPNECINASNSFEDYYKKIQICEKDSDCTYIGSNFLPITLEESQDFIADDCSFIKPLIVANHFGAVSNQLELLTLHDLASQVCRNEEKRMGCKEVKRLKPVKISPLCIKSRCVVHPLKKMK